MTDTNGVTQYGYDVLDRLSLVTYPGTPTTTAYTYDGRRQPADPGGECEPGDRVHLRRGDQLTAILAWQGFCQDIPSAWSTFIHGK